MDGWMEGGIKHCVIHASVFIVTHPFQTPQHEVGCLSREEKKKKKKKWHIQT